MPKVYQYKLDYWPTSGDLWSAWYKDEELVNRLQRTVNFEADDDNKASAFALQKGLATNSDGVLLMRLEDGWVVPCYRDPHSQQPQTAAVGTEADL